MVPSTTRLLTTRLLTVAALTLALLPSACRPPSSTTDPAATAKRGEGGEGLRVTLSPLVDAASASKAAPRKVAVGQALSMAEIGRVLARLPALASEASDTQAFALREGSQPPPRKGETVVGTFPPPPSAATAPTQVAGPLEVLRRQPEGDVALAPHLSVTFSQPMIAVTSHDEASKTVPVKLSPQPAGQWRWVGTKTLIFDPDPRFPMATTYTVTVPAGTTSATGGVLAKPVGWSFQTPPPRVERFLPQGNNIDLKPVIMATFDQAIDPAAVLRSTVVTAAGKAIAVRQATAAEREADAQIQRLLKYTQEGRWVAFVPTAALPKNASVKVAFGAGLPSAEGPRKSASAQDHSFHTYAPLTLEKTRCGWRDCRPGWAWSMRFNNALDEDAFDPEWVTVEPALEGLQVLPVGREIQVNGLSKGHTKYTITFDAALRDRFGQTLGKPTTTSVSVGSAEPAFWMSGGPLIVLDPSGPPELAAYVVNMGELKVKAYRVGPEDWPAYRIYLRDRYRKDRRVDPPGELVIDTVVKTTGAADSVNEVAIDLRRVLREGVGHTIVVVSPTMWPSEARQRERTMWVQGTHIGLGAFVDAGELIGWVTNLQTGKPLSGVELTLTTGASGKTGADGLSRLALPETARDQTGVLIARKDGDVAFLPERPQPWGDGTGWVKRTPGDSVLWYVFDDRQLYRPGETAHFKGWVRRFQGGEGGDLAALGRTGARVKWKAQGPRGNVLAEGTTPVDALGGFDLKLDLPKTPNLGHATVALTLVDAPLEGSHYHRFRIQEFRRPEFEVSASASAGPHLVGGSATLTVDASYYTGGPLPGADTEWRVTTSGAWFSPPNRGEWTFGRWFPWWHPRPSPSASAQVLNGKTDGRGRYQARISFDSVDPPRAMNVRAEAFVADVNRQRWASATSFVVHPADVYVGLRSARLFVERGKPLKIEALVVDLDGKTVSGRPVTLTASRMDWRRKKGKWVEEAVDPETCRLTSAAKAGECQFATKLGGRYRVRAVTRDASGRPNESELTLWVAGGKRPPQRAVTQEHVQLIPDKRDYRPGEVAEVLVQAPFAGAEVLFTIRRSGIVETKRFRIDGTSHTLRVPVTEAHVPNLWVNVDLVGEAVRANDDGVEDTSLPRRAAYAQGGIQLRVPPVTRALTVTPTPRAERVEPGGKTAIDVEVRGADGAPVAGAQVALVVVDESVLSLAGYALQDPLALFYALRHAGVSAFHSRGLVRLADPERSRDEGNRGGLKAKSERGPVTVSRVMKPMAAVPPDEVDMLSEADEDGDGLSDPGDSEDTSAIAVRKNFDPLAVFAPAVATDAQGRAVVEVTLPDNLTRYRVMAVAVEGARRFGHGESALTARLPLMIRPSAPRFLNFGDRFELPVVVQNQTDSAMSVDVAVRVANAQAVGKPGQRVQVPANDRVELLFPMTTVEAGTARFQVAGVAGRWSDAASFELPVWTPATSEAFATYGVIDKGAVRQPVKAPGEVWPQFGGLEVTTSSTQLQALTDAVLYLVSYPYECSEQRASRVIAIAALKDVLTAFDAEGLPTPKAMMASVGKDVDMLKGMQNSDGGFPFWQRGHTSWPYLTVHVTHALTRAKAKGFEVPKRMLSRAQSYLKGIERHFPSTYGQHIRRVITSYALYVRQLLGDRDAKRARGLISEAGGVDKLPLEALGWLIPVLSGDGESAAALKKIHRYLGNRVTETAGAAHFATSYSDGAHLLLHSDRRADALLLEALIGDKPSSDLIPKLVRGLLGHRKQGRWGSTQENAFVLLALDRYFQVFEKVTPDFMARVWLGDGFAGEHRFKGRTTERHQVEIPMAHLAKTAGARDLVLAKSGKGRMYYRVGMRYAPKSLELAPADHGFAVQRSYEAVGEAGEVTRDAEGVWHIKAGAEVRVRVSMVAPTRRYHVALVDPLPAGLEPVNPAFAASGSIPEDTVGGKGGGKGADRYWYWWRTWYEHQNMRDERVEAFSSMVWAGVHEYTYVARATTPGTFVVPPPKAEEMYSPETFGRGASATVVIR